jgi:hypothetical protein
MNGELDHQPTPFLSAVPKELLSNQKPSYSTDIDLMLKRLLNRYVDKKRFKFLMVIDTLFSRECPPAFKPLTTIVFDLASVHESLDLSSVLMSRHHSTSSEYQKLLSRKSPQWTHHAYENNDNQEDNDTSSSHSTDDDDEQYQEIQIDAKLREKYEIFRGKNLMIFYFIFSIMEKRFL